MASVFVPGQPVPSSTGKGPTSKYGVGTYERDGVVRASLVGLLENNSGVRVYFAAVIIKDLHTNCAI